MSKRYKIRLNKKLDYLEKQGYLSNDIHEIAANHLNSISEISSDLNDGDKENIKSTERQIEKSVEEKSVQIEYFNRFILNVRDEETFIKFFKDSLVV